MCLITFAPNLRRFCHGMESLTLNGPKTLSECLIFLCDEFPQFRNILYNKNNCLNDYVNIYLNKTNIRESSHQEQLTKTDHIEILTNLMGG